MIYSPTRGHRAALYCAALWRRRSDQVSIQIQRVSHEKTSIWFCNIVPYNTSGGLRSDRPYIFYDTSLFDDTSLFGGFRRAALSGGYL